jgi:hypothetical protein
MKSRTALILCVLLAATSLFAKPKTASQAAAAPQHSPAQTMSAEQTQELQDDLKQMRVLVQQMQTNLSFVDTTQSPLKHQFQLEIDMWNTLIRHMEKRLGKSK